MLTVGMNNVEMPNVMILGEQGIGKTALVEQWLYERQQLEVKELIVALSIETLGELGENMVVSRMKSLLSDIKKIKSITAERYPSISFELTVFIDEVHKLDKYGNFNGSSGAMNALKESTARAEGRLITATTDYEYRKHIAPDPAFDRRFLKVILTEPTPNGTKEILKRRLRFYEKSGIEIPQIDSKYFDELIKYADAYVRNQVNPAKSLALLSASMAYVKTKNEQGIKASLDHEALAFVFKSEGYNIDSPTTAEHVKKTIRDEIKGQPLAIKAISEIVNATFYTPRNLNRPMLTMFSVGTTGTGKSETAKLLAKAFFGRKDALLVLNGGDYSGPEDGIKAQNFIGDRVAVNKQLVILWDEIEKSHKNVLNSGMRMIDEGVVKDSLNIERSINNTVLVATSNLGAEVFSELASTMRLDEIDDPDELTEELEEAWYRKEAEMRKALQSGDKGLNNGIRPEFLERFKLFVPYLPLPKKVIAQIARKKLLEFKNEMATNGYYIQLPGPLKKETWQKLMPNSKHTDIDSISVMIAEDIVNSEAATAGARTIDRFIETSVKTKVANYIAERMEHNQSVDGAFRVSTNGEAMFESLDGGRPDVKVEYIEKGASNW